MGKLSDSFFDLHAAGCIQTGADVHSDPKVASSRHGGMFAAIYGLTHGNPCAGCPAFNGGRCKAYQAHHEDARRVPIKVDPKIPSNSDNYPGMSVKQIAEKLGVSMSEVRRRKLTGTL